MHSEPIGIPGPAFSKEHFHELLSTAKDLNINFVRAADKMIKNKMKVNNEYYVAPVYNMMIEENARIGISNIGSVDKGMYGLGTPSDLENFLNLPISKKVTK